MRKLIAGNWKMNGSLAANEALVKAMLDGLGGQAELNRGFAQGQERGVSGGGLSRRFGC